MKKTARGIYVKDILDAVLAVIHAERGKASYARIVSLLAEAVPETRLVHAVNALDAAVKKAAVVRVDDGKISLTPAGQTRIAAKRCPEGLPHAVVLAAYAHENSPASLDIQDLQILAILASYDDPLTLDEIVDEVERREGKRPDLSDVVDRLYHEETLSIARTIDEREAGYVISNDGMDRYESALHLLMPRAALRAGRQPMFLAFADVRSASGQPILGSDRIPHRVREAIQQAADDLVWELNESLSALENDTPETFSMDEILPRFFVEKYDQTFLRRFADVVGDIIIRLKTDGDFSARSVAEALAMRDIMNHAKEYLAINSMSGMRPPSQRENRFFIYIDSQIFNDRFFEMLYSDLSTTIYATESEENPNLPDLSFANWFEPFKNKQQRVNDRDRAAAQNWLLLMEREIFTNFKKTDKTEVE